MKRGDKAVRIAAILDEHFPEPPIPLDHSDPFTLLVAVLLSAQCTDARVNLVTPGLFEIAGTPQAMAQCTQAQILDKIKTCGLANSKAKHLYELAAILLEQHGGEVPANFEDLEALPGVGHKTASVVMSQAFGHPAFPVDTHIHRLAARWGLSDGKNVKKTESDLKKLFPPEIWNRVHLQMIYFGRKFCPARGHDWPACPICSWAASKRRMNEEQKRGATKKTPPPARAT